MRLINCGYGIYARPQWLARSKPLVAVHNKQGTYYVCPDDDTCCLIREASTAYKYDDFEQVRYSKLIEQVYGTIAKHLDGVYMVKNILDIKVVVMSSNGVSAAFESEEEALNYIADIIEEDNKAQHIMLKPYQKVVPKRVDISKLIVKLD